MLDNGLIRGAIVAVPGFLLGYLIGVALGFGDVVALFTCGVIFVGGDVALRWTRRARARRWLIDAVAGGTVFVFPLWSVGIVQVGVGLLRALGLAK